MCPHQRCCGVVMPTWVAERRVAPWRRRWTTRVHIGPRCRLIQAMWTHRSPVTNNASRTKRSADFAKPATARRVSATIPDIGSPTASAGETLMRSATNAPCTNDRWRPRKARWGHRAPPQGQGANAPSFRVNPRPSVVKSRSGFASIRVHSRANSSTRWRSQPRFERNRWQRSEGGGQRPEKLTLSATGRSVGA
jgi:hypothetical protein